MDLLLCAVAFFAGFVDAVAGGGGLVQLPFLMILRPELAPSVWLGTNKFSSVFGTTAALFNYSRSLKLPWEILVPAALVAFFCSLLGASLASQMPKEFLKPLIISLLILIFIYTLIRKEWGKLEKHKVKNAFTWTLLAAGGIGFYDGFFGPGTGGFLIFIFVSVLGMNFLNASASSKVINWMTNIAALIYFGSTSNIAYEVGIPMAACNLMGGFIGAKMALKRGVTFVRVLFYFTVVLALIKLIAEYWL